MLTANDQSLLLVQQHRNVILVSNMSNITEISWTKTIVCINYWEELNVSTLHHHIFRTSLLSECRRTVKNVKNTNIAEQPSARNITIA